MKSTKVVENVHKAINNVFTTLPLVKAIVERLDQSKGRALLVGGVVRDCLREQPAKDIDIEVHGLAINQLEQILKEFGNVRLVGKAFGVLRIDGLDVDWSIPRVDSSGRKPKVEFDPHMPLEKALLRRDLTINAMAIDMITKELQDPFNGLRDLQAGILRVPDKQLFIEDPLRYFRVMQFIGRFQMTPDKELYELGRTMDLSDISQDRIVQEFEKLCIKGIKPSLGIQWLRDTDRLKDILPEIHATIGIEQDPEWHPEGDVYEHSKQAMDAAVCLEYETDEDKLIMVLAGLCHDVGKAVATQIIDGKIRSLGHDVQGVPIAATFLDRVINTQKIKDTILKLVRYHMMPVAFIKNNAKSPAYKRLAKKLAPETNIQELTRLAYCDKSGRNPDRQAPFATCPEELIEVFLEQAKKYGVDQTFEPPVLMGKDLIGIVDPGPALGKLLAKAYKIQIEEGIIDKEELKKRLKLDGKHE
ncbi:MAG: tRNA nucleotidyltransferase (CCA-adding enzyme) [Alteromonas naphthalenivorans]|jgi:tRNA nucleotidyltransferase (CCA-adding enzyme)